MRFNYQNAKKETKLFVLEYNPSNPFVNGTLCGLSWEFLSGGYTTMSPVSCCTFNLCNPKSAYYETLDFRYLDRDYQSDSGEDLNIDEYYAVPF